MKWLANILIPVFKPFFAFIIGIFAKDFASYLVEYFQRRAEKKEQEKRVAELEDKVKQLEKEKSEIEK